MTGTTILRPVVVRFTGAEPVEGPVTLGQLNILNWLAGLPDDHGEPAHAMLDWPIEVPDGATVADFVAAFTILLARHEGLRTTYPRERRQRVIGSGELSLHVLAPGEAMDPATLNQLLAGHLDGQAYDPAIHLPLSVALAVRDDRILAGLVRYSHLAVDRHAMMIIGAELAELVRAPASRVVGQTRHQPLDQAMLEQGPLMRRRVDRALDYWATLLGRMPRGLYAGPRNGVQESSGALELSSAAAALALRSIEARTGRSRASAVLAAICAVLSARTGYRDLVFAALSGNRHERVLSDYVGTLAMSCLVEVGVAAATFDELTGRAWSAVARAGRSGLYDVSRLAEITRRTEWERGICFENHPPSFNNAVVNTRQRARDTPLPSADDLVRAMPRTRLTGRPMPPTPAVVRFDLWEVDDVVTLDLWSGDTGRLDQREAEAMLLAVERLLVAAAAGDVEPHRIGEIVDLVPIARGAGWLHVDSCWVELAEVQRLLDEAMDPSPARVFTSVAGRSLVAYVAASEDIRNAADAHTRCMARLYGRHTAISPRHYVVCEQAPGDPTDLAAWQRLLVLDEGSGRHAGA